MRSHRKTVVLLVSLMALLTPGLPAASAGSAPPPSGANGLGDTRIVWSRFVDSEFSASQLLISDYPGGPVTELTQPREGFTDDSGQLSPAGSVVLFERYPLDGSSRSRIGLVNPDGTGQRLLDLGCRARCASDVFPRWAPDGPHFYFTRIEGPFQPPNGIAASAVLYRSNLDGTGITRVSEPGIDGTFEDYTASVAPAGYLVFGRVRTVDFKTAIFRMNLDGTDVRQLTPWSLNGFLPFASPATSGPTEDLVVFRDIPPGRAGGVATVPGDCPTLAVCAAGVRQLTSGPRPIAIGGRENVSPSWSPDGTRIAYARFTFFAPTGTDRGDIWTMRYDGSDRQPFSTSPLFEFRPSWGVAPPA